MTYTDLPTALHVKFREPQRSRGLMFWRSAPEALVHWVMCEGIDWGAAPNHVRIRLAATDCGVRLTNKTAKGWALVTPDEPVTCPDCLSLFGGSAIEVAEAIVSSAGIGAPA